MSLLELVPKVQPFDRTVILLLEVLLVTFASQGAFIAPYGRILITHLTYKMLSLKQFKKKERHIKKKSAFVRRRYIHTP